MSTTIFGVQQSNPTVFSIGAASVTIDDIPAVFLSVQVTVARQLTPIPTINKGVMWSAQPPQGELRAETILTKSKDLVASLAGSDASPCKPKTITVDMGADPCNQAGGNVKLTIKDGFCSSITFSIDANRGYVGSGLDIRFTQLDYDGTSNSSSTTGGTRSI